MSNEQLNPKPSTNVDYNTTPAAPRRKQPARARMADGDDRATELANSEELHRLHGEDFRHDIDRGADLAWDGRRWAVDRDGALSRAAMAVARSTGDRLAGVTDEQTRKRFVARAESAAGINGVLALFRRMSGVAVTSDALDTDDFALTTGNGTLDLCTGRLRPHSRDDLMTVLLPVDFDPDAPCPRWLAFLHRVMDGNADLIGYLQRLAGVALTGTHTVHELPILYGGGANGKSVFTDTLLGLLGGYGAVANESLLVARGHNEHATEIARLRGKRLVIASETETGATLRLGLVKKLTGDAVLTGRFMRGDFFEFRRTNKTWLVTNARPRLPEDSEAVWRRLRVVPFTVTIPPAERAPDLLDRLRAEWPGILAWAVRGCLDWQADGMRPPDDVLMATDDYRAEADELGEFIAARCIVGDHDTFKVARADLLAAYLAWCRATNERRPLSKAELYEALRRREGIGEIAWKANRDKVRGFTGPSIALSAEGGGR